MSTEVIETGSAAVAHAAAVDAFRRQCIEVQLTVRRLPRTRAIKGKLADTLAQSVQGNKKGIRGSWSLFSPKHEAVKALNAAIGELGLYVDRRTLAKGVPRDDGNTIQTDPGVRLLWADDVEDFYKGVCERAATIDLLAADVAARLDSIKEMDRKLVGDAWEASAYASDIANRVGLAKDVAGDYIVVFRPAPDFSAMRSGFLARKAASWFDERLSASVEAAVESAVGALNEGMGTFLRELTGDTVINPKAGHPWLERYCQKSKAKVIRRIDAVNDAALPAGYVKLYLEYEGQVEQEGEDAALVWRTMREWTEPIPAEELKSQVRLAEEGQKRLYPAVLEKLMADVESFRAFKSRMLGTYGEQIDDSLGDFLKLLGTFDGDTTRARAEDAIDGVKRRTATRQKFVDAIGDAIVRLDSNVEVVRNVRRTLRLPSPATGD